MPDSPQFWSSRSTAARCSRTASSWAFCATRAASRRADSADQTTTFHARTAALVLNCLETQHAGEVLKRLPPEQRRDVSLQLGKSVKGGVDLVRRIAEALIEKGDKKEIAIMHVAVHPGYALQGRQAGMGLGVTLIEKVKEIASRIVGMEEVK